MKDIFKCNKCGNMVEEVGAGSGELVCCEEPMERLVPNTVDAAEEKHVPVIEYTEKGVLVKVGKEPHPMEEAHYIEWVEIGYDARTERKYLKPGDAPEATFVVDSKDVKARAHCNIHGLWVSS
ncbi:MAG: desulfoferrodoxin [Patescibacteria group bacterium]|nr:desulfoferrodoxin [Patescibacteria group bacterium]